MSEVEMDQREEELFLPPPTPYYDCTSDLEDNDNFEISMEQGQLNNAETETEKDQQQDEPLAATTTTTVKQGDFEIITIDDEVSKKSKTKKIKKEKKSIPDSINDISKWLDSSHQNDDDTILISAWFNIWAVIIIYKFKLTDCSEKNCEVFCLSDGIEMVRKCGDLCLLKPELAEVMLGALGNVAEVDRLRPQLIVLDIVQLLYKLLDPPSRQPLLLKIRFGAASILINILSDGPEAWKIEELDRNGVLKELRHQIERKWDVNTEEIVKTFSYKSLKHIWRLFRVTRTVECHLFAAWSLANLVSNIPEKYGLLLLDEEKGAGGKLLEEIQLSCQDPAVLKYAKLAFRGALEFFRSIEP